MKYCPKQVYFNKEFFIVASALLLSAFLLQAYASVFVYYPASLYSQPVKPPLIFQPVSTAGVFSVIEPTNTSAQVNITTPIQAQLLQNPDFNMSSTQLLYWSYDSNTTNATWSLARGGGVGNDGYAAEYSGSVWKENAATGRIYQSVNVPGQQLNINISYQVPNLDGGVNLNIIYGLYNSTSSSWICYGTASYSPTLKTTSLVCTPVSGTYNAMVEIDASTNASQNANKNFTVYIDNFTITTSGGAFNGTVLQVYNQDSQPYYAVLTLDNATSTYSSITSCNITLGNSAPIQIQNQNGQVVTSSTSEVQVAPQSAVPINVDATVTAGTSTLNLTLRYCTLPGGNGACVSYPLTITLNSR